MLYFILTVSLCGIVTWMSVWWSTVVAPALSRMSHCFYFSYKVKKIFAVFFLSFSYNKWQYVWVLYQWNIFSKEIFPTTLQTALLMPFSIASSHYQGKISRILYGGTNFLTMKFRLLSNCWLVNSRTIEKTHHILLVLLFSDTCDRKLTLSNISYCWNATYFQRPLLLSIS